jgi:Holliday junction resolvasome RuvABC endonuclease subunit
MSDLFATITAADEIVMVQRHPGESEALFVERAMRPVPIARARAFAPAVNVLALDLGTHCGWAAAKRDGAMEYGTESFHRLSGGNKWASFRAWLSTLVGKQDIDVVYFEDVKAHGPGQVLAAHAYGGFLAMAQMVCHQHNVRMVGVGVGTVKKAWTGKGNARKPEMIAAAQAKGFRVANDEDDTADALAILSFAVKQEQ